MNVIQTTKLPFFILFIFLGVKSWGAARIEVVAQVGNHVITSREVEMDQVLEAVLTKSKELDFKSQYEKSVREWVVFFESQVFNMTNVTDSEVAGTNGRFKSLITSSPLSAKWKSLQAQNHEIDRLIERKLRAQKLIKFKSQASMIPITDAEALSYYQKNRYEFGKEAFAGVRQKIKALLIQTRADQRIDEWFNGIEKKHKVRRVLTL
jgi:hypothetical protein